MATAAEESPELDDTKSPVKAQFKQGERRQAALVKQIKKAPLRSQHALEEG